jgi:HD superfamily phosphodiesterase
MDGAILTREKIIPLEAPPLGRTIGTGEKKHIRELLHHRSPALIREIRRVIEKSELQYCGGFRKESFLWQHTVYVASMAMKLSYQEGVDPIFPVVTALFHDCGKFENGKYHDGEKPEEEIGAQIAQNVMAENGFDPEEIDQVQRGLLALYNEDKEAGITTRIVHDADSLIKFGHMGFGNFFERSVLRGMVIRNSILRTMSKELTYAASLKTHMLTRAGKKMAEKKSSVTISLFRNYLEELRTTGISDYEIRKMDVTWSKGANIPLILVLPSSCDLCWNPLSVGLGRKKGIKRDRLTVNIDCPVCSQNSGYDFSFCPPT